jgi:hypothetical protein
MASDGVDELQPDSLPKAAISSTLTSVNAFPMHGWPWEPAEGIRSSKIDCCSLTSRSAHQRPWPYLWRPGIV